MNTLKQKFGLAMATSMVIGIVIGSGIFIKSAAVLTNSGASIMVATLAWLIGGFIMITNAYSFSLITVGLNESNGLVGYVSKLKGEKLGYYVGFYMSSIYLPVITSVIAYFSADYLLKVFGIVPNGLLMFLVPFLLLIFTFGINLFAPKISEKFQISTTFIKLIPIVLMVLLAIYSYFVKGHTVGEITSIMPRTNNFFGALLVTCFAYEGWIVATSIHSEIKNPNKNMPKALFFGALLVVLIYIIYNIAISVLLTPTGVIEAGNLAPVVAFEKLFGGNANFVITLFLFISCMGTLNGLSLGTSRSFYSLSKNPYMFKKTWLGNVNEKYNVPFNSSIVGFVLSISFLIVAYFAFYKGVINPNYDAIVCALLYITYIPLYISLIKKFNTLNIFNRFVAPILAILGSVFFVFLAMYEFVRGFINGETIWMRLPIILIITVCALIFAFIFREKENQ